MYFFTADEHYGHENIIRYSGRPFSNVKEMDQELIDRHNSVVDEGDVVIHAGDFTLKDYREAVSYQERLNGHHIFLRGSHDRWLKGTPHHEIWEWYFKAKNVYVVVCHYAMRTWARSHYNSWNLYGHSHGKLSPIGKQYDIGVDSNDFTPVSIEQISEIMKNKPDNPNLIRSK